jgi:DNA invertase Pin-like site-specific DNA recombinase
MTTTKPKRKAKTLRLDAYIRVSRVNGRSGESFLSPDQQREKIEAYAKLIGAEIACWHEDYDQSGGKLSRPGLDAAMARIEEGLTGGLIVAKIDRFARAVEAFGIIRRIMERDAIFASADEKLDPLTAVGKAMLQIILVFAEMELDRITANWADVHERCTERGVWIGPAPLGFVRSESGRLLRDGENADAMTLAYEIAAADGVGAARRHLVESFPDKRWDASEVRRILANKVYLGQHHNGGPGHEAITDATTFAAAQTEPGERRANGDYPLSHLAHCERCGSGLVGALQTVRTGTSYRRMRCSNAACKGGCSISADKLEEHVRKLISRKLIGGKLDVHTGEDELALATAALEQAHANQTAFMAGLVEGGFDATTIALGAAPLQAALEAAEDRYADAASRAAIEDVIPAASELDDPAQLRRAVRAMVATFTVTPGRGAINERAQVRFVV